MKNLPNTYEKLNLDLLEADSNKILEELGILQKPSPIKKKVPNLPKSKVKEKTVDYLDFLRPIIDGDDKSTLDIIEAKIVTG